MRAPDHTHGTAEQAIAGQAVVPIRQETPGSSSTPVPSAAPRDAGKPPIAAAPPCNPPARSGFLYVVEFFFRAVGLLSPRGAARVGCGLGWLMGSVFRFRRGIVDAQLALAFPELDAVWRRELRRRVYRHLGMVFVETARLPCTSPEELRSRVEFHGLEHLAAARSRGKGVFLLSGHFGSWEMCLAATARAGFPLYVVSKDVKGPTGQYAVDRIRGTHGVRSIPRRKSIFQILRALRQNAMVGFVLDQNTTASEGVFVNFFGRPACTLPSLAVMAQRHGTPVLPVFFHRDEQDPVRHHATVLPEIAWEEISADPAANIVHNTQRYSRATEEIIRRHPDQWLWLHRRWRTQPPAQAPTGTPPVPSRPADQC